MNAPAMVRRFWLLVTWLLLGVVGPGAAANGPQAGQIIIDPEHPQWLMRQGGRHVYICGPGDPEDFLYRGTRRADGTRDGDQKQLIEKLAAQGGNSIYLQAVRTHGGDAKADRTQNPFVDSDPAKAVDDRILNQWEEWFTLMDRHDILIYFLFYDDSARIWNTGDTVGAPERAMVETIVKRFQHHRNLIWVVGEESEERYTTARVQALARVIQGADGFGHLIGDHHHSGTTFKAWEAGGALNHFSMQLNAAVEAAHTGAIEALARAGGRYQIIYSEDTGTPKDVDSMRRHAWAVAMGGVMPMVLQMDIAGTPVEALQQCRHLQKFFEATDFYTMTPQDELKHGGKYVLADAGRSYIAYTDAAAGALGIQAAPAGRCELAWLDCVSGRTFKQTVMVERAGNRTFEKPKDFGAECAVWIHYPDIQPVKRSPSVTAVERKPGPGTNQAPVVKAQRVATKAGVESYIQLNVTDEDGPGPYTYTIVRGPMHGTLTGDNNDRYYQPQAGFTGTDEFTWRVNDGKLDSAVATVTITVTGASADYFPLPESKGGWRQLEGAEAIRQVGGMDPAKLAELKEWLLQSDKRPFAATVIRHGHIVLEVERGNSAKNDARRVASVSKAVCATVLAIASEQSQQGLTPRKMKFEDPAFEFIPWAQPLSDPRKAKITVKQLFNHTSGLCPEAIGAPNDGTWEYVLGLSGDARTAKLAFDPGTASGYSTHALCHASLVCETVTGKPYDQFAIEALYKPLGIEHWWFQYYEGGEKLGRHPSHSIGLPARELARIAYCMLHEGRWDGRQVIPKWFVRETGAPTHNVTTPEMRFQRAAESFSHAWELPARLKTGGDLPADARFKPGSGGQLIAFVPSLDLVITRQTGGSGAWEYEEYLRRACAAVVKAKR
jgi:CubicO group peptidase (beta-lactamase class C family)